MSTINGGSLARGSARLKPVCALTNSKHSYPAAIHSLDVVTGSHESQLAVLCNHVTRAGAALHSTRRYRTGTQDPLTILRAASLLLWPTKASSFSGGSKQVTTIGWKTPTLVSRMNQARATDFPVAPLERPMEILEKFGL